MTREEAINVLLTESVEIGGNAVSVCRFFEAVDMAVKALLEQMDVSDKDVWKNAEWISVKDRLPEKSCRCLVFSKWSYGESIEIATYTPNYQGFEEHLQGKEIWYDYCSEYGDYEKTGITHWMKLPDKPKEADHA